MAPNLPISNLAHTFTGGTRRDGCSTFKTGLPHLPHSPSPLKGGIGGRAANYGSLYAALCRTLQQLHLGMCGRGARILFGVGRPFAHNDAGAHFSVLVGPLFLPQRTALQPGAERVLHLRALRFHAQNCPNTRADVRCGC